MKRVTALTGRSRLDRVLVAACAAVALAATPALGQTVGQELAAVRAELAEGRRGGLHLIAPDRFERAEREAEQAARRIERGDSERSVRERIVEARSALREARRIADAGSRLFGPALAARADALEAGAPESARERWTAAEELLREAGERFEDGDTDPAAPRAARAVELYTEASRGALRATWLGEALEARTLAVASGARELAPQTFARAEERFTAADARLVEGTAGRAAATAAGARAAADFRLARRIADLADSVARRRVPVERLILAREADLHTLARALGLDPHDLGGMDQVVSASAAEIRSVQDDRARLRAELAAARDSSEALRARLADLDERLTDSERREAAAAAALRERERREARLREVQALFSPEEGDVVISGDQLILRLHGLTFESGSDEILPEHGPLLIKVQRVITDFPGAEVRVDGHTDSRGSAETNRALSQRRAIAVREHLLARLPISADRITATGYGEERPIASDDTAEGRARNRRIEVVLTLPP